MYLIRILIVISGLLFLSCSQHDTKPLRLGTNVWTGYEPLYLAREMGELPAGKLRLVEYPSASEVIRAFRNHALEMASLTLDEALLLVHDGVPLKVILVHDISNGADTILARPGINSMKELKGKRVAVESGALGAYVITRALELNQLSLKDIKIKHLDVNDHEKAYLNNEVDAVVNFEPVRTRLLKAGAKEIFTSKQIYGEIVDVMVVHEDIFNKDKARLKQILDGWFNALNYFHQQPENAAPVMARRLNVTPAEVIASFDGLELPDRQTNRNLLAGNEAQLKGTVKRLAKVLKDNNLITKGFNDVSILTGEILEK